MLLPARPLILHNTLICVCRFSHLVTFMSSILNYLQQTLIDNKAQNIEAFDVRHWSSVTDHMLLASGSSQRQVKALADYVVEAAKQRQLKVLGVEGRDNADWVLVDLGDILVHIMYPETRAYYAPERLWGEGQADSLANSG